MSLHLVKLAVGVDSLEVLEDRIASHAALGRGIALVTRMVPSRADEVLAGYQSVHPLNQGWRDRIALHQLYPLLAHAVLFGGGYGQQAQRAAAAVSAIAG